MAFFTRLDLNLREPTRTPDTIPARYRKGVVAHFIGTEKPLNVVSKQQEIAQVRGMQRYHMDHNNWSDAAYSFAVGQHTGDIYEIRGWDMDQFANGEDRVGEDNGSDRQWYTCVFMLGSGERPSQAALDGFDRLVGEAQRRGAGREVLPHNAFRVKECPGVVVTAHTWEINGKDMTGESPELVKDIMSTRIASWAPFINDATTAEYSAAVELLQRLLKAQGLDPGDIDGYKGQLTIGAMKSWSNNNGYNADGILSRREWVGLLQKNSQLINRVRRTENASSSLALAQADRHITELKGDLSTAIERAVAAETLARQKTRELTSCRVRAVRAERILTDVRDALEDQ